MIEITLKDQGLWHLREQRNAIRWMDDTVRNIILGFRERGLEDETLFVM